MSRPDPRAAATTFDAWAADGRDADMARGHRRTTRTIVESWPLAPDDFVVDIGCGNGWALRWCRERGAGGGLGVDISSGMVERARALTQDDTLRFEVGRAAVLPLPDATASRVLSVEALYYTPDPAAALREWRRVARAGARLGIMIDLYAEARSQPHGWTSTSTSMSCRPATRRTVRSRHWTDVPSRYRIPAPEGRRALHAEPVGALPRTPGRPKAGSLALTVLAAEPLRRRARSSRAFVVSWVVPPDEAGSSPP